MAGHTRSLIRKVHLWLGLSLGALFALLGLSGSALVFYQEIDALLHPAIRQEAAAAPAPGWTSPAWDRALATARTTWPDKDGAWRFEVTGRGGAIPARYYPPGGHSGHMAAPMLVWFSADGATVLRQDHWGDTAMTWLYELHMRLLAGATGELIVGCSGLAILLLLGTGIVVWWPRGSWRKAIAFKRDAAPIRRLRDLHKLSALWSLPLLLILVATGVMLALPEERDWLLARTLSPVDPMPRPESRSATGPAISIVRALAAAHDALPQARLAWIEAPGPGAGVFRLRMQQPGDPSRRFPHSFVHVDQHDARVLAVIDAERAAPATVVNNWLHPLHDGSVGGLAARILVMIVGVAPAMLFITGLLHWRRRSRARTRPGDAVTHRLKGVSA